MSKKYYLLMLLVFVAVPSAYAQHHGGEQAPPVSFAGQNVTVETALFPSDFVPGIDPSVNLNIRFFDATTNTNVDNVTYRVQILHDGKIVANKVFFDKDGSLDMKIQPRSGCEMEEPWQCTKYQAEIDPIVPSALTSSASSKPVVTGPVFSESGEYIVKTEIIGAKNPKSVTEEVLTFENSVMIPHQQQFEIIDSDVTYEILARHFGNPLSDLQYESSSKSISILMPIEWSNIEHIDSVQAQVKIPKDIVSFDKSNSILAVVNTMSAPLSHVHYDRHLDSNYNNVHFTIDNQVLKKIQDDNSDIRITISPHHKDSIINQKIVFDNKYSVVTSLDTEMVDSKKIDVLFAFFDSQGNLAADTRYGYSIKDPLGKEIVNTGNDPLLLGINVPSGAETRKINIPQSGAYSVNVVLIGNGPTDFETLMIEGFEFEVQETSGSAPIMEVSGIPKWIKNNAQWWSEDIIGDDVFVQGIQFMIKNQIIDLPATEQESVLSETSIPSWVKDNAGWWAQDLIDDSSFIQGMQYLVQYGFIRV